MRKFLTEDDIESILYSAAGLIGGLISSLSCTSSVGSSLAFSTESLETEVPASMSCFSKTANITCGTSINTIELSSSIDSSNDTANVLSDTFAVGGVTGVGAAVSSSSNGPIILIELIDDGSFNYGKYDTVDIRADRIYDMLTKNTKQGMIVVKDSEMADILEEIYSMFDSKEELIVALETYKNLLLEKEKQENDIKVLKREKTID